MANLRIKDITTTASSTASGEYLAIDGLANGTRKLSATAPTFAGAVTATGGFVGALTGNADTVTTNANLTGPITSSGNATSIAAQTGTGTTFVTQASPTLTTPDIGTPSAGTVTNLSGTASININGTVGATTRAAGSFTTINVESAQASDASIDYQQIIKSTAAYNATPVAGILFQNKYNAAGNYAGMGGIDLGKENATDGNLAGYLAFHTRSGAGGVTEQMRIDSAGAITMVNGLAVTGTLSATQSIHWGTGGSTAAGSIYSDSNWGAILRAYTSSPSNADFLFQNSAGVTLMELDTSGLDVTGALTASTSIEATSGILRSSKAANDYGSLYLGAWGLDRVQFRSEAVNPGAGSGTGSGKLTIFTAANPTLTAAVEIGGTQAVRFNAYGAGTATFDSSGNITSVSDARAKDTIGDFTTGLAAIRQLQPKLYNWKPETGLVTTDVNASVYAQDLIAAGIPEAVSTTRTVNVTEEVTDDNGEKVQRQVLDSEGNPTTEIVDAESYSVNDRAVISVLINAVKELASKNDELESRIAALETK